MKFVRKAYRYTGRVRGQVVRFDGPRVEIRARERPLLGNGGQWAPRRVGILKTINTRISGLAGVVKELFQAQTRLAGCASKRF